MEKLTTSQQESVRKMSSERLQEKLVSHGYDKEAVKALDRDTLMAKYAEVLSAKPVAAEAAVGYDVDIERERLALQKMELEEKRLAREWDMKKHAAEMEIKLTELKKQDEKKPAVSDSTQDRAACLKRYGEALKNVLIKQSNDPIEIVAFFKNAEATFEEIKVPPELRGILIRPFLNDRSKALVARLDPEKSVKYLEIKDLILKEYKLSAATYQEKFSSLTKDDSETFTMFSSRLGSLIDGYLETRQVTTFQDLRELLICDRIKSTLTEGLLKYILSVESKVQKGWMKSSELTTAIDTYIANHVGDRPRSGMLTAAKPLGFGPSKTKLPSPSSKPCTVVISSKPENKFNSGCFVCGSKTHIKRDCPNKNKVVVSETTQQSGQPRKAYRCVSGEMVSDVVVGCQPVDSYSSTGQQPIASPILQAYNNKCDLMCDVVNDACDDESCNVDDVDMINTSQTDVENDVARVQLSKQIDVDTVNVYEANHVSKLNYVKIGIASKLDGNYIPITCLEDSGTEIPVLKSSVIDQSDHSDLQVIGCVKIRGIVGQAVECKLVRLYACMLECDSDGVNMKSPVIPIMCAVTDEAHEQMILPRDVIDRMCCMINTQTSSPEQVTAEVKQAEVETSQENSEFEKSKVNVVTRSGLNTGQVTDSSGHCRQRSAPAKKVTTSGEDKDVVDADQPSDCDVNMTESQSTRKHLREEQLGDVSLHMFWNQSKQNKGNLFLQDGILMHKDKILGQEITQLVVPKQRRSKVLEMGHDMAGHASWKKTLQRIKLNFTWPGIRADTIKYVKSCDICQKRARVTCWDRVPISPIERAEVAFSHWFMDVGGPLTSENIQFPYFLIMVDSMSRFPVAYALRSVTAKSICDCLLNCWSWLGVPSTVTCDNASYNVSALTQEVMKRFGCSPRFITVGHSEANGLAERYVGTAKSMIAKIAAENPKSWHKYLGFLMWSLRELPNDSTGVPPWLLALGTVPRGPLAVLKETWCGEREVPPKFQKEPTQYLRDLHDKLQIAEKYADLHTKQSQQQYAARYNRRAKDKHFSLNDKVLILQPDNTKSRVFSRWKGPATIVQVKSPHSYVVDLDGIKYRMHANQLRQYSIRADEVTFDNRAFDDHCASNSVVVSFTKVEDGDSYDGLCELFDVEHMYQVNTCVRDEDTDFGDLHPCEIHCSGDEVKNCSLLPSQRIDMNSVSHLSDDERQQLFAVLDKYPDVFRDEPGLCKIVQHKIPVSPDFKPKRLKGYRIPEKLKPNVEQQINDMLQQNIIRRSTSPMASPIVCILKGPGGRDGVRIVCDFRYLNRYTISDAYPIVDIQDVIQRIGKSRFLSTFDCSAGYWQTEILEEDRWKTGFVFENDLFEWNRTAFGLKSSGCTFCRNLQYVLRHIKEFAEAYIDDAAVHSGEWQRHLEHIDEFLQTMRTSGITLKLKKCQFALPEIKFCGQLVGSGTRRADPDKIAVIKQLVTPVTKKQVRQIVGFFSYFRENIPHFADLSKPLTDLTAKTVPNKVPWGQKEQTAYDELKQALCKATENRLAIIDMDKPFYLLVDASDHTVSGALTQIGDDGIEHPVAFCSLKLNKTQRNWATVEKEAYAALSALRKYYKWVFGAKIIVVSDNNPITYLTESAPKSAKLMRWSLAMQDMNVEFKYRAGRDHVVPDVLTRLVSVNG